MDPNENYLTQDDISDIIKKKLKTTQFEIIRHHLQFIEERVGLLGDYAFLTISVQEAKQEREINLFVKFFPFISVSADFAEKSGAFRKEVFVNKTLIKELTGAGIDVIKDCTVECYLIKDNLLVFDNLAEEGFVLRDKYQEFDFDIQLTVLKSLAKLHASSLVYEEKMSRELKRTYRLIDDYRKEFEETFYNDREGFVNLRGVRASARAILTEIDFFRQPLKLRSGKDFKTVAGSCFSKLYELVKPSVKSRNVISHGDLWSSNLFLKFNEKGEPLQCKFVDFQLARYVPPSHDVMSVLYLTTSREFRKKYMEDLLKLYYENLELHVRPYELSSLITYQEFLEQCEVQRPFAIMQSATYFQLVLLSDDALSEIYADPDFVGSALEKDRSPFILRYANKIPQYRRKLEESIQDIREYCEEL